MATIQVLLNIGRKISGKPELLTESRVRCEVARVFPQGARIGVWDAPAHLVSEPTFVVEVTCTIYRSATPVVARVHQLSIDLEQEAIALWVSDLQIGLLAGPKAAAWGVFNPDFFVMPQGYKLSQSIGQETAS